MEGGREGGNIASRLEAIALRLEAIGSRHVSLAQPDST